MEQGKRPFPGWRSRPDRRLPTKQVSPDEILTKFYLDEKIAERISNNQYPVEHWSGEAVLNWSKDYLNY
ncbi:MAG: hypothetical protein WBN56_09340 [Robiginitalea sp.]